MKSNVGAVFMRREELDDALGISENGSSGGNSIEEEDNNLKHLTLRGTDKLGKSTTESEEKMSFTAVNRSLSDYPQQSPQRKEGADIVKATRVGDGSMVGQISSLKRLVGKRISISEMNLILSQNGFPSSIMASKQSMKI